MLSFQIRQAEIHIQELTDKAHQVSIAADQEQFTIITKRRPRISELLIFRLGDLLIVTGQRLKTQVQTG